MSYNDSGIATFKAGVALEARRRVKIESGTLTDPPEIEYAGAGEDYIGVTEYAVADGDMVAVKMCNAPGVFEVECLVDSAIARGCVLYGAANGRMSDAASGSAQGIALEVGVDYKHIRVAMWNVKSTTAATVTIDDSGEFTTAGNVETALAEIYQHIYTAKGIIDIPMPVIEADGTALAVFSNGDSATPGYSATAEAMGIRWNNHAEPDPVATAVMVPPDMDVTANAVLHILAAKVGATVGDATKFTVGAFNNDVAALFDADDDFGGDTSAMTGDATSKTVQEVTLTLATANLTAYPAAIQLTIQPKDGTLGTDDVILLKSWIEYQRKVLTA
jgi:hypothetical protein